MNRSTRSRMNAAARVAVIEWEKRKAAEHAKPAVVEADALVSAEYARSFDVLARLLAEAGAA